MITIEIKGNKDFIQSIKIYGHAGYASRGYDIVCAAVSTLVTSAVNYITAFGKLVTYKDDEDIVFIENIQEDATVNTILLTMIEMCTGLAEDYKDNILIKYI